MLVALLLCEMHIDAGCSPFRYGVRRSHPAEAILTAVAPAAKMVCSRTQAVSRCLERGQVVDMPNIGKAVATSRPGGRRCAEAASRRSHPIRDQVMTIYTVNKEVHALYKDYEENEAVAVNGDDEAHCALLVQKLTGAPVTSTWKRGDKVRGGTVTPGTAIATFMDDGNYDGNSGVCHAAIFIKAAADHLYVWDQWKNGHLGQRKADGYRHGMRACTFKTPEAKKSKDYRRQNDGDEFYVIKT